MSNYSLIPSPPPELMEEWRMDYMGRGHAFIDLATKVVQWGADRELEACCLLANELLQDGTSLRAARRPKPPSLKEQALNVIKRKRPNQVFSGEEQDTIRRALEALDD